MNMVPDVPFQVVSLLDYTLDYAGTALLRIPRGPQSAFTPPSGPIPILGLEVHRRIADLLDNPSLDKPAHDNPGIDPLGIHSGETTPFG
jgi:hypothetical protein